MAIRRQVTEVHLKQCLGDTPSSIRERLEVLRTWGVDQVLVETMEIAKAAASLGLKVVLDNSLFDPVPTRDTRPTGPAVELYFKEYDRDTPETILERLKLLTSSDKTPWHQFCAMDR
jgi:hypothetical protein